MKYLVVGLGNPGEAYEKTRHNLGFLTVDRLADLSGASRFARDRRLACLRSRFLLDFTEFNLAKPLTFMNRSGESVARLCRHLNIEPNQVVICADDSNLPPGRVRVRFSGEAGGHKGIASVVGSIGADFWRVRIGIGQPAREPLERYVLRRIPALQEDSIMGAIDKAASYLLESFPKGLENKTIN